MAVYVPRPPVDDPWIGGKSKYPPLLLVKAPFKAKPWNFNYDDASIWVGQPNSRIPLLDEPAGGGFPFKPPYWKYNNDDPGFWVGAKTRSQFQGNLGQIITTSTNLLPLPVNCVLIGQQVYEPGTSPLSRNLFRSIFRE